MNGIRRTCDIKMKKCYLRLDDASEHMNLSNWIKLEQILNVYNVKPIFGIIPNNLDPKLNKYEKVPDYWNIIARWINSGWIPALHGYTHVFETKDGGINPVNKRSEFAGLPLSVQKEKIREGLHVLHDHGVFPRIFFAPGHTFDKNTIVALREESDIRIISDTIANKTYSRWGFTFIPQQSGRVRNLPLNTVTFCYHPNTMREEDFYSLETFLVQNQHIFSDSVEIEKKRSYHLFDRMLKFLYFLRR